jgi:ribosome-associated translation inhibitor RaiA/cold shock CspA family protein
MQTALQITFKDMDHSDALETIIRERARRMEKFHRRIISCRVVVEAPHRSAEGFKPPLGIAVEVKIPGQDTIVAKDAEERREVKGDHTAVVNRAFEAIERQLREVAEYRNHPGKQQGAAAGDTGVVVRLFPQQGYGFIEIRESPDLYFTRNAVVGGSYDDLEVGTVVHVTRATEEGPMGPQASSVRLLGHRKSPE